MANTLTNLIPDLYSALDIVSREQVGFVGAVSRDSKTDGAALNQVVNVPVVGAVTAGDITPGNDPADDGDTAPGNVEVKITKSRYAPVRWTGEEQLSVRPTGIYSSVQAQRFAQAMRTLTNEAESDLAALYAAGASRAYGTAGTAPFNTANDFSDLAFAREILESNGAPTSDLQCVLGTTAMANLRAKQSGLFHVNEAGTERMLRDGIVDRVQGFALRSSGQVKSHTKGTGASYTSDTAGYAVGATSITLITGTGTVLAGDVVTFAGDTNKYIVKTGVAAPGAIVLQEPGLKVAIPASATAMTIGNTYTANMAFDRNAIVLATRSPEMPEEGDAASDVMTIQDPVSGLAFQVAMYKQYRRVKYEVGLAWGVKEIAPRHSSIILG